MKNLWLGVWLLMLVPVLVWGQCSDEVFSIGVATGLNFTSFYGDSVKYVVYDGSTTKEYSPQAGLGLNEGLLMRIKPSPYFGFDLGFAFATRNSYYDYGDLYESYYGIKDLEEWTHISAFEIPVIAKLFIPLGCANISVGAGPNMAVTLSSKYEVVNEYTTGETHDTTDEIDDYSSFDLGMVFMVGGGFSAGYAGVFSLDAGYMIGLTDMFKDTGGAQKTNGFKLLLSWTYPIVRRY